MMFITQCMAATVIGKIRFPMIVYAAGRGLQPRPQRLNVWVPIANQFEHRPWPFGLRAYLVSLWS